MHSYEESNGSLEPNKRAMPRSQRRSSSRWVWLSLMFVGVGNCTYWSWQTLNLPDSGPPRHGILTEIETPPLQAETSALVMANAANLTTGSETSVTDAPLLPPTRPSSPNSKPAALGKDVPRKKGPVLDKMTAETGLQYEPNARAPQSGGMTQSEGADTGAAPLASTGGSSEIVEEPEPIAIAEQPVPVTEEKGAPEPDAFPKPPIPTAPERFPEPIILEPKPIVVESETPPPPAPPAESEQVYIDLQYTQPVYELPPPVHHRVISPPEPQVTVTIDPNTYPAPRPIERPRPRYHRPAPPPPPPPPYMPVFDYDGRYVVQIASFRNVEVACAVWDDLRVHHPRLFGDAETIVRPHRTQTGTFVHRLRVGAFANRGAAKDWCQAYLEAGGECFVTRR
ncbi:MAG: SPOR domain-containing protein [Henriciella sp.]